MIMFLYHIALIIYATLIKIASIFNVKAKNWIKGRENYFERSANIINNLSEKPNIWIHAASLGEFEQARPIIEQIKQNHKNNNIILTFFSPSGYLIRKHYELADAVLYLPIDTPINARKFVEMINPKMAIFIKYEFWFFYIRELNKNKIPIYLASAIFRQNHFLFKPLFKELLNMLKEYKAIFVQDEYSSSLLQKRNFRNVILTGDTRFDRVYQIAQKEINIPLISDFVKANNNVMVAGSTWHKDEHIIAKYANQNPNYKYIIAPHEINEKNIEKLCKMFDRQPILFSQAVCKQDLNQYNVMIIDSIGMLSQIYKYAKIAYIGGGFGKGIHNVLEPATFAIPIIFGTNYHKFNEAKQLIKLNVAFSIKNDLQFEKITNKLFTDEVIYKQAKQNCAIYIRQSIGATSKIINHIEGNQLL